MKNIENSKEKYNEIELKYKFHFNDLKNELKQIQTKRDLFESLVEKKENELSELKKSCGNSLKVFSPQKSGKKCKKCDCN